MDRSTPIAADRMRQLLAVTRRLAVTADLDQLLHHIALAATGILGCERASIFLHDPRSNELWSKVALQAEEIRLPAGAGIVGHVFQNNTLLHVPDPYNDPRFNSEPDRRSGFTTRNLLTSPMVDLDGRPVGVLQAINKINGSFAADDETLIQLLSDQAGVAIQRYRLQQQVIQATELRREMELARQVQQAMIPHSPPQIDRIDSAGWSRAASITGGDCYDLWKTTDGRLGIFVGDATGHGIGPAMVISQTRTMVRAMCDAQPSPKRLLACANERLAHDLESGKFVTAFVGFLGPDGRLDWCSAGHGPIFVRRDAGGPMQSLDSNAPPLGIVPEFLAEEVEPIQLQPGGLVCVSSDGIFESFTPDGGEQFGVPRLIEILSDASGQSIVEVVWRVRAATDAWQNGGEPLDDQTLVVARYRG